MHVNSPTDPSCTSGKPLILLRLLRQSINHQVTVLRVESKIIERSQKSSGNENFFTKGQTFLQLTVFKCTKEINMTGM